MDGSTGGEPQLLEMTKDAWPRLKRSIWPYPTESPTAATKYGVVHIEVAEEDQRVG